MVNLPFYLLDLVNAYLHKLLDNFYYLYRDYNINAKQIVKVGEELSFGRNTKIVIMIENDVVFDPFMGSGTTGKMAILNNRKFIGIEKVPEYFDIVVNRMQESTIKGEK